MGSASPGNGSSSLRRFGSRPSDLGLDLAGPRTVEVLEGIVGALAVPGNDGGFRSRPVGESIRDLLGVLAEVDAELAFRVACPHCGQSLDLELPTREIHREAGSVPVPATIEVKHGEQHFRIRVATGADLIRWATTTPDPRAMVVDLMDDGIEAVDEETLRAVDHALSDADPFVDCRVAAECSQCGRSAEHAVKLDGLIVETFRIHRADLLYSVHRMATAYHWTEEEILAIPAPRRRRYLDLIAGDGWT